MLRFLLSSLRFYWRSHIGVLLGTAVAVAVLTGSLLVGDSVDGSLRKFALQRLGNIEQALFTPHRFFSASLAGRISDDTAAVLQLRGMALAEERQINRVMVSGCDAAFWKMSSLKFELAENEIALNEKLASALGVDIGDEVMLRVEKPGLLPGEAPLSSQKDDRSIRGRFRLVRVVGDNELGRFSLSANQAVPYNAFVDRQWLEDRCELKDKANLLVSSEPTANEKLARVWQPRDFGLQFRRVASWIQLESEAVYLSPEAARAALSIPDAQGTLTYLVNSISKGMRSTPYSFVLASDAAGRMPAVRADDEISINQWLADELQAGVGDTVRMKYFELQPGGRFKERERGFRVSSVMPMEELALERQLAPEFPGLTDVDRCSDWDVGIPMEEALLEDAANEEYWNAYKQTPKAVVSLKAGQEMWSNRFGGLTGVRWSSDSVDDSFREAYVPADAGFLFLPVRKQAIAAVEQALDFGQLFVGMSFFLIVAALMLTGLLFVFGIQKRTEEMGTLLATGWRPAAVRKAVLMEGGLVALVGSMLGSGLGVGYTRLLIYGLTSFWPGAIAHSSIQYFGKPETVLTGAFSGFICAVGAMTIAVWRQSKHPARELLAADAGGGMPLRESNVKRTMRPAILSGIGFISAGGIVVYAMVTDLQSVTLPFFGAGALLLISGILFCGMLLRRLEQWVALPNLAALALRNTARRHGRSLTVIGLLASGTFLVFAVSSMKEDVTAHAEEPGSGTGGFAWFGESTLPIADPLGGVRLRVHDGDDASCLNLNRARTPRLLGVDPRAMSEHQAFCAEENIWEQLRAELPDGTVPALVGDTDTAMWGLEAKTGPEKGDVLDYVDEAGRSFRIKLVGQLPMRLSVFQGSLLLAEEDFVERFPGESGYRLFLLNEPVEGRRYERAGLDVVPSVERLLEFYAVESTYLAMFLVLGAFGLAVGSIGMGVVVLRNVQDRRSELALLQAVGYRNRTLRRLLFIEHGMLLAAGLLVGVIAAAVAMLPAFFITRTQTSPGFLFALLLFVTLCGIGCMAAAIGSAMRTDALGGLRNE